MKNKSKIYTRNCPSCGKKLEYKHQSNFSTAKKKNSSCLSCSRSGSGNSMYGNGYRISGEKNGMYGRVVSEEEKVKHSKFMKDRFTGDKNHFYGKNHADKAKKIIGQKNSEYERTDIIKKNIRVGIINNIKNRVGQVMPNYNISSIPIIEQKADELGITDLQHAENGGEYHIKELGYWVDGYSKEKNIVIEYYEKSHKNNIERDLRRQNEILNLLKCKFIIINE